LADPWAPPPEERRTGLGCAVAFGVVALVVLAGMLVLGVASDVATYVGSQDVPKPRSFSEEVERAMSGPADTATVSPGPDGSRAFAAPAPAYGGDGFRLTLPRGWEGRHIGARSDSRRYLDSVLTSDDPGVTVLVERVEYAQRPGGDAFLAELRSELGKRGLAIAADADYATVKVGDVPQAYRVDGSMPEEEAFVVVFQQGLETFQLLVAHLPGQDAEVRRALAPVLASWRWV
jgi:hypothetical protein